MANVPPGIQTISLRRESFPGFKGGLAVTGTSSRMVAVLRLFDGIVARFHAGRVSAFQVVARLCLLGLLLLLLLFFRLLLGLFLPAMSDRGTTDSAHGRSCACIPGHGPDRGPPGCPAGCALRCCTATGFAAGLPLLGWRFTLARGCALALRPLVALVFVARLLFLRLIGFRVGINMKRCCNVAVPLAGGARGLSCSSRGILLRHRWGRLTGLLHGSRLLAGRSRLWLSWLRLCRLLLGWLLLGGSRLHRGCIRLVLRPQTASS